MGGRVNSLKFILSLPTLSNKAAGSKPATPHIIHFRSSM